MFINLFTNTPTNFFNVTEIYYVTVRGDGGTEELEGEGVVVAVEAFAEGVVGYEVGEVEFEGGGMNEDGETEGGGEG